MADAQMIADGDDVEPSIVEESLANSTKRVERWRAAASFPPPSARARQDEIMVEAREHDQYLPAGPANRSDCKVLVKRGLLEPNGCLGYRPTGSRS